MAEKFNEISANHIVYSFSITTLFVIDNIVGFMMFYGINVLNAAVCRIINNGAINNFNLSWLVIIWWNFIALALIREQVSERFNIQR